MANRKPFLDLVSERVVVLDGAMGSNLQTRTFDLAKDWLNQENISEVLNFTRPDVIQEIHEAFLNVGCDAVETNTFGANKIVMAEAEMADRVYENNVAACKIARAACDRFETPDRPRYVIGAAGGGTKLLSLGMTTWDIAEDSYYVQFKGLLDGGCDVFLFETQQDLLIVKVMIVAAERAMADAGRRVPIIVQASMDQDNGNQMLTGSDPSALVAAMAPYDQVQVLGLNCAFGPIELMDSVRHLSHNWPRLLSALPNAGLPIMVDGKAKFPMTPPDFTKGVMRMVDEFGVNVVGGCCGTMPEHLGELCKALGTNHKASKRTVTVKPQISSLYAAEDIRQDLSYLIVAERTNTNGSRQFKRLLQEGDIDGLTSMARDEVRDGSHMLDVCVDFVGRNGIEDMQNVVGKYVVSIRSPLMLDSTDPKVLEAGLKLSGGRCVLNSMNLEEGEEKLAHICKLAKKYGAAVVAGTIDEDKENAMARTKERKLAIATRIRDLAAKYGIRDEDIMFDPLVLPISTGIEEDRRNALETIEGTRLISEHLPKCHTVVGLSNVSFGLKPAARVVLNSAFLHELREAGLTGAIVHASKILPKNRIPQERWDAAMDLIYDRRREGFDPLTHFVNLFPDETGGPVVVKSKYEDMPLDEALKQHIVDGEKRDLTVRLQAAIDSGIKPLDIINNILLEGMKVVGDLFGRGEMQLPFVLQSAETMKASVAYLEPFMEKVEGSSKGRIILATVKGDVHDIGKNLVDIILTNNGYDVVNLGIKQPVADILKAYVEHKADAIGMSGLLVKSVAVMKENLEELNARGVKAPVLLGGAALTRDYAEDDLATLYQGPLLYCRDAFDGLKVMDYVATGRIETITNEQRERSQKRKSQRANAVKPSSGLAADVKPVDKTNPVPVPPFWGRRVVKGIKPANVFPYINETALFTAQWGYKRKGMSVEEYDKYLDETARPVFQDLQRRANAEGFIDPKVVYGYFPVQAQGDDLIVYHPSDFEHELKCDCGAKHDGCVGVKDGKIVPKNTPREWLRFSFPRQHERRRICISDYYRTVESGEYDVLGIQLVTVGDRATELAEELRKESKYQDYLYLHGFGVESAEALAEMWHKRMRQELGFGSEDDADIRKIFQQNYRGSRYSFGYPACPNLEDRAKIVEMLKPEEIGVALSENYMLVPEQSTDALVAHHPQAKYFDVD